MQPIKRWLQILGIGLSVVILMMASGCVKVNIMTGTPNEHMLLFKEMADQQTQLLDCTENTEDVTTLNCRTYKIKLD